MDTRDQEAAINRGKQLGFTPKFHGKDLAHHRWSNFSKHWLGYNEVHLCCYKANSFISKLLNYL